MRRSRTYARVALAAIRLINGGAALVAPGLLARMLGLDPEAQPGGLYFIRLFGVRTVVIGAQLLVLRGERLSDALRLGVLIHGSDTLAASLAARSGKLPGNTGARLVLISAVNTALALYAQRSGRRAWR